MDLPEADPDTMKKTFSQRFADALIANPTFIQVVRDLETFKSDLQKEVVLLTQDVAFIRETRKELELNISALEENVKDCRKEVDKGMRQLDENNDRFLSFASEMSNITSNFDEIYSDLRLKASQKELNAMQTRFSTMCPMTVAQKMQYELEEKASEDSLQRLRQEFEQFQHDSKQNFSLKTELLNLVSQTSAQFTAALTNYAQIKDCDLRFKEMDIVRKGLENRVSQQVELLSKKIGEGKMKLGELSEVVQTKASLEEAKALKLNFENYASVQDFNKYKKEVTTLVRKCEKIIGDFGIAINGQEQVLARYDEVLLEKASKVDLIDINNKIRAISKHIDFEEKVEDMDTLINYTASLSKSHTEQLQVLEKSVSEALQVTRSVKSEKRDIIFLKDKFAGFFDVLGLKADKVDLVSLSERKANSEDLGQVLQSVEMLHRLVKMSAVLLSHTLKGIYTKPQDSKNGETARRDWLMKHAEMVVTWANDFSPLQPDSHIPEELPGSVEPSPMNIHSPMSLCESPKFGGTHRRLKTRAIKLPSIDTSF